jgi:hypothetical protein
MPFKDPEKRRAYQARYHKEWYRKNAAKRRQYSRNKKRALRAWWDNYRKTMRCVRCGESDIACLDLHHREGQHKSFRLSLAISDGFSKARILAELKKCEALCANCHRKLHWARRRSRKANPSD